MPNKKHYLYLFPILLSIAYAEPTLKDQWPEFRGPNGNGIVVGERGLPTTWSEEKNIAWKTKIDGKAWSSPVVWDDQIWITNSSVDGKLMEGICINKKDGKIKYRLSLFKNDDV